jgi:hypothetical protein
LDSYRKRLAGNQQRLENATDDKTRQTAQRQIAFYEKQIAKVEAELQTATIQRTQPANTFENTLESMSTQVADQPATAEIVAKVNAELSARGLVAPEPAHPQRVDLSPDGPPLDLPVRKMGQVPIELRAERLGALDHPLPAPPEKAESVEEPPAEKE